MTKKPRQKQLKLKDIEKLYNDTQKLSVHVLNEEENLVIKYYSKFDNKQIELLMKEAYENLSYDINNKINFLVDDERFVQYILFLTIKYFTELRNEIPSSLDQQIPVFNQLISTGIYEELLNNCLDGNEVSKVLERFAKFSSLVSEMAELEISSKAKISKQIQHPLLKEKLTKASDNNA